MSARAYMFPGQGAQTVGMGKDLCEEFPVALEVFERAESACGLPLRRLCFEGPMEELSQTANSQPALVTCSIAALEAARGKGLPSPDYVLGLSLGEYAALYAAGVLSLEDSVKLVHLRGAAMQKAAEAAGGTMTSILGASEEDVVAAVEKSSEFGVINTANFNCPGQVVISGEVKAIEAAEQILKSIPRVRVMRLNVSGAFHSQLMAPAAIELKAALDEVTWLEPEIPIVQNVCYAPVKSVDEIRRNLVAQVTGSVHFERSVNALIALGVVAFTEVGPGRVLAGLVRRTSRDVAIANLGLATEIAALS
ncbi:MAG: ACP S-malonyltransferase [Planctomycetota bacterium]